MNINKVKATVTICLFALLPAGFSTTAQEGKDNIIVYSPEPYKPIKIMFDYYHHALPATKIGKHIITGGWATEEGRYGWNDFYHTNSFDNPYIVLEDDYQISMSRIPYSKKMLSQTDAVVIITADRPDVIPHIPLISDDEIVQLKKFVEDGGSLMVMLNAGTPQRSNEGFEHEQLGKLVRTFGLDWNDNDTHYSDIIIPNGHPYFYDVPVFHYGAGCTLIILPEASKPEVLLNVYSDVNYSDRTVEGPGIVMVRPGKGKFILVGDAGSWGGNITRPWAGNERLLKQMFQYLKPDRNVNSQCFQEGQTLNYEVRISGLQAIPVRNNLAHLNIPFYKTYSPREATNMPYFERTADLTLRCKQKTEEEAAKMEVNINNFRWFEQQPATTDNQSVSFTASRQGKVTDMACKGDDAQWLAPDITNMIALIPVDGLRPGDTWNAIEILRIPILRGSDMPLSKRYDVKIKYVCDTELAEKKCRLIRSSGDIWLNELGVTVDELLPLETVRQIGGSPYRYFSPQGGKLMFKREQWVDATTGIVLKAVYQSRLEAWIQDIRIPAPNPYSNADKDNDMVVTVSYVSSFIHK